MRAAVEVFGLELPDVLFLLNTDDAPVCNREQAMNREWLLLLLLLPVSPSFSGDVSG